MPNYFDTIIHHSTRALLDWKNCKRLLNVYTWNDEVYLIWGISCWCIFQTYTLLWFNQARMQKL